MNFWPGLLAPSEPRSEPTRLLHLGARGDQGLQKTTQEYKCLKGCCQPGLGLHGRQLHPASLWQLQTSPDQCH
ncbi:Putative transposable element [Caligus rogercresseyi]|uniref:Transposable element n=1 Tax=Caligus rogercresseyi TaxID=217165 RepID=A0A7T8GYZ4_CALRO|nr:Putative transposable element [Caligus rogercresseyi]